MTSRRRATLRDVATRAGVSKTTASYILNGHSDQMRIASETQRRVHQAATELRYRPNPSAQNLRTSTTRSVGVISDFIAGGPFASQMLTGASEAARTLDHVIVIGESGGDPELERLLIEEMQDRRVDGIVYASLVTSEITVPPALAGQRVVLLNCVDLAGDLPSVIPDEQQGGRSAAAALEGVGDGETWVVGEDPTPGALAGRLRLAGIDAGLSGQGRSLAGVIPCLWDVPAAYEAVGRFLDGGGRPSALICLNDRVGMGAYQALQERGLDIPGDVSVVSFDGSDLARWLRPSLTSVSIPYPELGARAIELILDDERPAEVVRLPMPVAPGASVRADVRPR